MAKKKKLSPAKINSALKFKLEWIKDPVPYFRKYLDAQSLKQIKQAKEKKDNKTVNELSQKLDLLEEKLGPEYVALMDGLEDIDPKSEVAQEIESVLDGLYDNLCGE